MKYFSLLIAFFGAIDVFAQAPVINSISPVKAGPAQKIVITGSGFSSVISENEVWFDHVKGTVTAATIYSLEVQVPPQARLSNVEVINKNSAVNRSAKSPQKFIPYYGGVSLPDATKLVSGYTNTTDAFNEFFDIASADFDLDGKPDLVTARGGDGAPNATDMYVFKNTSSAIGTISYSRYAGVAGTGNTVLSALNVGYPTLFVAAGDLNGDGKPDIVASRCGTSHNQVFVIKNSNTTPGTLAFNSAPTLNLDATDYASVVAIHDLNGDGLPEVIVSNLYDDSNPATDNHIYIFPNKSSLSSVLFGNPIKVDVAGANTTYGLEVQDFDGDSKADIIVTRYEQEDVFVLRNTSTGILSFDTAKRVPAPDGRINLITSADVDNDGKLDLIGSSRISNNVQIWINNSSPGTISFNSSKILNPSLGSWGVDVSDIDGDGDVDIIVCNRNQLPPNYNAADVKLNIFRQDGFPTFTKIDITTTTPSRSLRVGDYDGDGKPDIAFSMSGPNTLTVLRNTNCWDPKITSAIGTTSPVNICAGQQVLLQTKPALGVTYTWAPQTSSTNTLTATGAGTYTVNLTGTVDTGCNTTSPGFTLNTDASAAPADPVISNNVPCLNSTLNLSTTSTADTYVWAGPNNFSSSSQNPSVNPVTNASAGVYTLQLKMNNGCASNIVSKTLDVASVPVLPVTASPSATGCTGGTVTLNVPSSSSYTYQWNKAGSPISGATTTSLSLPSLSAADEADYNVSVTSISNSCTQPTGVISVKVLSAPVAGFTVTGTQCSGSTLTFTDQSTKDSRGTLTYNWTFGDAGTSSIQSPTHSYATANTFTATLQVSYSSSCPSTATKSITISAAVKPTIATTANPICAGDQTTLSISGTYNSITWSGVTGTTSTVTITQPGMYKVSTIDANGCSLKDSLTINLKPTFAPFVASAKRLTISAGDTTQLISSAGADSYSWTPIETLDNPAIANPIAKPAATTAYIVVATKAGTCNAMDTVTVTVISDTGGAIAINAPVLFSPNGDTHNDFWAVPDAALKCPDCIMTIYDGHGSQVYQQKGYNSSNYWDGTFNGKPSPDGTYFYVFSNSKDKPATGSVLLVR